MSTAYDPGAAGALAGFNWQQRKALLALLTLQEDGSISLESDDDVVILNLNGEIVAARQYKHSFSVNVSITLSSVELWKTIRVWSKILKKTTYQPRFVLATTAIADPQLLSFREPSTAAPSKAAVDDLLMRLSDIAQKAGNKELRQCYEAWLGLKPIDQRRLVENFRLADNNPHLNRINTELLQAIRHRVSASGDRLTLVQERLIGWFEKEVDSRLTVRGCTFTTSEFADVLERFRNEALPPPIVFRYPSDTCSAEELEREMRTDPRYLKQLALLNADEDICQDALISVLRARTEREYILNAGLSGERDVSNFDDELYSRWNMMRRRYLRGEELQSITEEKHKEIGWSVYDGCMQYTAYVGLARVTAPTYLSCGSFHLLADQLRIGWHPQFAVRLKDQKVA